MNYDFPNKRQWRRTLYSYVDQFSQKQRAERRLLYLESSQALETIFLVKQKGYKPGQLYPVCDSPAVQAWITTNAERAGIRGLNVKNGLVEDVIRGYAEQGIFFDSINLDFTGPLSRAMFLCLAKIGVCLRFRTIVSVTILRGRESNKFTEGVLIEDKETILGEMASLQAEFQSRGIPLGQTPMDAARLELLKFSFATFVQDRITGGWLLGKPKFGFYLSESGQTMLYYRGIALRVQNVEFIKDYIKRSEEERLQLLDMIPRTEWQTILDYGKLMDFRPADYGMLH